MKRMIVKKWDKIIITKTFGTIFQLATLEGNIVTSLFIITHGIEEQME